MMKKVHLIVIGNGMAGVATVEHVLRRRQDMAITIFGAEPYPNYNRILLSSFLGGENEMEELILHPLKWYEENHIQLYTGVTIISIDPEIKTITTDRGEVFAFDKLLIATGSNPFIPPIKGIYDSEGNIYPGVFTFRELKDAILMKEWAVQSRKVMVIGGGLLGIEAAYGLMKQGLEVTIAHLMDYLMETYLDPQSGELLKKEITKLGIQVLTGHCAEEIIIENGKVRGVYFSNGEPYEADMIVIATGIKPNIGIAKEAGLKVNRGIEVNDFMETSHPDIYAVGECAEHRGKLYGIMAPLMEQAEVAGRALTGDFTRPYKGSIMATKLKVAGIPSGFIGNSTGGPGCEEIVYSDTGAGIYKKLVISGGRLVGAILFGDLEGYLAYLTMTKTMEDISLKRSTLLLSPQQEVMTIGSMPDNITICGCKGVSKGDIIKAIEKNSLTSLKEVSEKTGACTSCRGCAPLIEEILQDVLGGEYIKQEIEPLLCDCIPLKWEEIRREVIGKGLRSVSSILSTMGNGKGCDTCKPALNYMLTEIYLDDFDREEDSLLINDRYHANVQKDGTFSVVPRIYGGVITPADLKNIAFVAEKHHVPMIKLTGGQRIDLLGIPADKLPQVWKDLSMPSGHAYTKAVRTCKTCAGNRFCRYGVKDSISLGISLEKRFQGIPCPGKIKMGVAGCPRDCVESKVKDIGIIGLQTGWEIYVGGNGGIKVRVADLLTVVNTEEEVIDMAGIFIQYYRENARWGERTSHFIDRVGIEHVRAMILDGQEEIKDRLRRRMDLLVSKYKDPWHEYATPG